MVNQIRIQYLINPLQYPITNTSLEKQLIHKKNTLSKFPKATNIT